MTDEEKKAIEIVEDILNYRGCIREDIDGHLEDISSLREVLDIIEKQSKAIDRMAEYIAPLKTKYGVKWTEIGIKEYFMEDKE